MEGHVREHRGKIMEGHVHEHGPLYASVPCVMFDEGGWVGGWVNRWSGEKALTPSQVPEDPHPPRRHMRTRSFPTKSCLPLSVSGLSLRTPWSGAERD